MILNLTQHDGTPEQVAEGLVEPSDKEYVQKLLTIEAKDLLEVPQRARLLARFAKREATNRPFDFHSMKTHGLNPTITGVMIGGFPAMMSLLEKEIRKVGLLPMYSFSERRSVDQPQPDGSVKRVGVFKHTFFFPAFE